MVLKPGESTTISSTPFMMHAGMEGLHDFRIVVKTNDPTQPERALRVLSNWVP